MKKYQIIYADPPWSYNDKKGGDKDFASAEGHYSCMNNEDIYSLKINDLADKNCVLFLWITFPLLPEGMKCLNSWGFNYKTVAFVWVKNRGIALDHRGIGHWTMCNAEMCLIGTIGKPKRLSNNIEQVVMSPREEHSKKPHEIRKRIVNLMGDLPRIELFARKDERDMFGFCKHDGWDVWGNEVESDIQL